MIRITDRDIKNHIRYIENHSDYRVIRDAWESERKPTYLIYLNDKLVGKIISDCKYDIWDMFTPFWEIAFENEEQERKSK